MINTVVKRDGRKEAFDPDKLNKWSRVAERHNVSWSLLAQETYRKLSDLCTTEEIHDAMVQVCVAQETIEWSRVAARLEYAVLRKNMETHLGIHDKDSFKRIYDSMMSKGIWKDLPPYNQAWEGWYSTLMKNYFEYWQVKQWSDKYAMRVDVDTPVETPHMGALAFGLSVFGDTEYAFKAAKAVVEGKVNLPTPVSNGCRNGDWNGISCCVISGGDTVESIGVAGHIAYSMTAKKAGIGIEFTTRSIGDPVKGGRVKHLGKTPIYAALDKEVKMFTQVTRGGSATVSYPCIDPEIEDLLLLKSQRTPENKRIDKLDYSFLYNDAFAQAVIKNEEWSLYSYLAYPEIHEAFYGTKEQWDTAVEGKTPTKVIKARDLLKLYLTVRGETGRVYCANVTRMNTHTPFVDPIRLSNLCQEIALPTKAYTNMIDLYDAKESQGETAFCTLAAINVGKITLDEYPELAELCVRITDKLMDKVPMMTYSMTMSLRKRRSIGIGITGLANYLYDQGLDYDESAESLETVAHLAETHYYYLLKASQKLAEEERYTIEGVNLDWLPVDTMVNASERKLSYDWEQLRGKQRKHSVLVAHMPTESSAVFSSALNGLYPARERIIYKGSRKGLVQYIGPVGDYKLAWDIPNDTHALYYSLVQDFSDQGISADYYVVPHKHEGGKVSLGQLMKEWVKQYRLGNKTMYYTNTNDDNGGMFETECEACKI